MSDADDFTTRLQAALAAGDEPALKALAANWPHKELPVTQPGVLRRIQSLVPGPRGQYVATLFAPTDDRPPNYPPGLPFLPQTVTNLIVFDSPAQLPTLQFYHIRDLAVATESLLSQSKLRGWIHDSPPTQEGATHSEWLHRGNDRRQLIATSSGDEGMIWLMDTAAEDSSERAV
jgi:hypothetical protein